MTKTTFNSADLTLKRLIVSPYRAKSFAKLIVTGIELVDVKFVASLSRCLPSQVVVGGVSWIKRDGLRDIVSLHIQYSARQQLDVRLP